MVASPPRQRRLVTLDLTAWGRLGDALADVDGKPAFVFGGIPGERVVAEVLRERRDYVAARVVEVLTPSQDRVEAPCPYFGSGLTGPGTAGACTGCQWQHIRYERQLELKRELVADALRRVGGLDAGASGSGAMGAIVSGASSVPSESNIAVLRTLPSPEQFGYRNHARFTVQAEQGRIGFVHRETHEYVPIDRCLLLAPWLNDTLAALQGNVIETTQLSLRYGVNTGSPLVQPALRADHGIASGQKHYTESLLGHTFQVSSPAFFQVNTHQAERLATMVIEALALDGTQTVVDAFAGVGTFAVLLADHARRVIAIEDSASALVDARVNVQGLANVELRHGRTEVVLLELAKAASPDAAQMASRPVSSPGRDPQTGPSSARIDAVVLDPPREGCMPGTLAALVAAPPRRIAYVSCDAETLARDLAVLTAGPFRIVSVQPVDMFPQTHHIECLAVLERDNARQARLVSRGRLVLASASPRRREILASLGLAFDVAPADVPEAPADGEAPQAMVERIALAKARAAAAGRASGTVAGFDTIVELDGVALGKPRDATHAADMLRTLRGREHRVVTGVALVDAATGEASHGHRASRVRMRDYTDAEIAAYVASGEPLDKAGAYAVQDATFHPAESVAGCYLNVVGLPVCTFLRLAERFGLTLALNATAGHPVDEHTRDGVARCPECAKRVAVLTASAAR